MGNGGTFARNNDPSNVQDLFTKCGGKKPTVLPE